MIWFWEHGNELFIFFTFPLIGLGLDSWISNRRTFYLLISSLILLSPIVTGYSYIISWFFQFFGLVGLSCLYSFYSRQIEKRIAKIISSLLISGLLFLILGWFSFMDSFSGFQKVENVWNVDKYKVEYVRDQGFAGGPGWRYELSEYGFIHIFIKRIDTVWDNDTTQSCNVNFEDSKMIFNKCEGTITELH